MLALLRGEARQRKVPSCVLTFEPHPRDYFAAVTGKPELAPARVGTLRDKLGELERSGVEQAVVLPFDSRLASLSPQAFIDKVLVQGLGARYVLVGDDFRFGAKRAGDYALLDAAGVTQGFDVARMNSYEVHGLRVSSSAVRTALSEGRMSDAARLLGHAYHISGHVVHGRKLGRDFGFPTLNLRVPFAKPAASGIFVVRVHGLAPQGLPGVASLGTRPAVELDGRPLLEVHVFEFAQDVYGRLVRVEFVHKLRDEQPFETLDLLKAQIARDAQAARDYFSTAARSSAAP